MKKERLAKEEVDAEEELDEEEDLDEEMGEEGGGEKGGEEGGETVGLSACEKKVIEVGICGWGSHDSLPYVNNWLKAHTKKGSKDNRFNKKWDGKTTADGQAACQSGKEDKRYPDIMKAAPWVKEIGCPESKSNLMRAMIRCNHKEPRSRWSVKK